MEGLDYMFAVVELAIAGELGKEDREELRDLRLYNRIPSVTIRAGTRLGPYEIVAPIGAGGMGEVYREGGFLESFCLLSKSPD